MSSLEYMKKRLNLIKLILELLEDDGFTSTGEFKPGHSISMIFVLEGAEYSLFIDGLVGSCKPSISIVNFDLSLTYMSDLNVAKFKEPEDILDSGPEKLQELIMFNLDVFT